MKSLEAWVEEPGISKLEPFEEPTTSPARRAMTPEVSEEEERLKALELAGQPITTPKTIGEAVDPALAIPRGIQEAGTTLGAGMLDLLSGYTGWRTIAELISGASPEEAMKAAEESAWKPSLGWEAIIGAISGDPPEVEEQKPYWRIKQGFTPKTEAGQKILDTVAQGFELIRQGAMVVGEQVPEPQPAINISPDAQAFVHDLAKTAVATGAEATFYVLMGLIGKKALGKSSVTRADVQDAARLRKGGERYYPPKEVSPEAQKLADEISKGMRDPELAQKVKKIEPTPREEITPLERIVKEPEEPIVDLVDVVKEPAERVVEVQRTKEVAKRDKEAKAPPKVARKKEPPEPPREEPTVVTSEGIKADTAEALKGKTPEEAYEIVRGIIEEFEDSPKYRFEDPFELVNFREWTDELSGKIVERLKKEGVVPEPEAEPPTVTLEFGGFQKMYEAVVERIKGDQPLASRADDIVRKGEVVKQRKSKGRIFPPVYELELEILKNAKVLGETWLHRGFENPIRVMEEAGGERFKSLTTHPYHQAEKSFYLAWRKARREIGKLERSVSGRSKRRVMVHALSEQKGGSRLLKASGVKEVPKLNPKEMELYGILRERYKNLHRRMNQVRRAIGVEEFPEVEDYFTFFRDLSVMERMGFRPLQMSNKDVNAQFVHMRSLPFRFAKPRKGGMYKAELDPFYVLKNYEQKALRYMHISPLVSKLREYQLTMPDGWKLQNHNPVLATALGKWTDFISGQKPIWSLPPAVESMMMRINSNLAAAILGANARSAAIQVTALRNTWTEIGIGYTAKGIESLIHPGRRNFALRKSKVLLQRTYDVTIEDALSSIRRGKVGAAKRSLTRLAMKPLQILDMETARATWQGAYEFAVKELNLGEKKAINFADDTVTRTQASAMPGDIAPIQRPVVGRFLTLFQTFTINDWNFLLRDVLGIRNAEVGKGKAFAKVMRYVAATTMFNILMEDGLHINSPFPRPIKAFMEGVERGDEWPSLAIDIGKEFIEPIPMIGAARYGKGPVGPAAELLIESSKWISREPMARPGGELFGQWLGLPGTAQYGKMQRAKERGESLYGQVMGAYTTEGGGGRPSRPARGARPTR